MIVLHTHRIGKNRKALIECAECGCRKHVWMQNLRAGKTRRCGGCGAVLELTGHAGNPRLDKAVENAELRAGRLGHSLGSFDPDIPHVAAVASCGRCDELAGVDLSEAPYLFGHAIERPCGVTA